MKGGSSTEWGADSLFWCVVWYSLFVFDQVFIKAIVDKYPASGWERTLYQVKTFSRWTFDYYSVPLRALLCDGSGNCSF
eukprot:1180141-Prorocentrum_minimum.AAC.6